MEFPTMINKTSVKPAYLALLAAMADVAKDMAFEDHDEVARLVSGSDELVLEKTCGDWLAKVHSGVLNVRSYHKLFPPKKWAMMKVLKIKLPEYEELKEACTELHRTWYRERPGILKTKKAGK